MKFKNAKAMLFALPMILTACSGGGGGGGNTGGKIKIKFWHTFGQTIVDGLNVKIKDFTNLIKENDGVDLSVELSYQGSYDDIAKKISDGY